MDVNFEAFWRCARNSLKKVIAELLKDSPRGVDKIFCTFSSPWFISQTRIIKVKREKSFEITDDFLKKLIDNEIKIFESQWQSKNHHSLAGGAANKCELVEYDVMKVFLNGYHTLKPIGKNTKTLEAYIYISLGIKAINEEIREIILKNFGKEKVVFHTLPIVSFSILEEIIKPEDGYIFIDIGGEVSDISLVRRGVLEETVSFSKGANTLIRHVAVRFKTFVNNALSLVERFKNKHMNVSDSKKMSLLIDKAKNDWCSFLRESLSEVSGGKSLPQDLFLMSNGDIGREFVECAKDDFFSRFTILGKTFNVKQILSGSLEHYFLFKKSFKKKKDLFLMMEFLFVLKSYE